jgi:hypothetical protein
MFFMLYRIRRAKKNYYENDINAADGRIFEARWTVYKASKECNLTAHPRKGP